MFDALADAGARTIGLDGSRLASERTASPDIRPLPQQELRLASAEESGALETLLDTIRSLGLDPSGDGRVLAAIAFRQLELFYAAKDALEDVREDNVPMSPDLHRLHGEVLAELGDAEGARRAFDRAAGSPR